MKTILRWGVVLGLLVEVWTYVVGFTGWYMDPTLALLFYLVIPIEIVVLVLALRQTAAQGRAYGSQVWAGTLIALFGGILVFIGSYLFTTVVFPEYFADIRSAGVEMYRAQGMSEHEIDTMLDQMAAFQTPFMNALLGSVFTLITGVLSSVVIAIPIRTKAQ